MAETVPGKNKGGRPEGSPNKRTTRVARMIENEFVDRGTSLIQEMVDLAMHQDTDPRVRAQLLLGMARFVYPQLQSVTVKQEDAPQTAFVLNLGTEQIEVKSRPQGTTGGTTTPVIDQEPQETADFDG